MLVQNEQPNFSERDAPRIYSICFIYNWNGSSGPPKHKYIIVLFGLVRWRTGEIESTFMNQNHLNNMGT